MKNARYLLEAITLQIAFLLFRCLPPMWASSVGGWLGRTIGPRLAATRKARRHFQLALPDMAERTEDVMADMWDNLGRTFAEYPHLKTLAKEEYTQIVGTEHLQHLQSGGCAIIFGAHFGNWEVAGPAYREQYGVAIHPVFRQPNNSKAAELLDACRKTHNDIETIPKSRSGARQLLETLKGNKTVGILIDQKYNEGIPVPFFGRTAMTSPAFVQLAQKLDIPLVPVRIDRTKESACFTVTLSPPLNVKGREVEDVIREAHTILETNIRERPGHWLWLHRRWMEE